jgi:hypothetical protein
MRSATITVDDPHAFAADLMAMLVHETERYEHAPPRTEASPSLMTKHMGAVSPDVVPSAADIASAILANAWGTYKLQPTAFLRV